MSKKDYYAILGVSKTADQKEIKAAYRKLALQYHPDKLKDGSSDEKMRELNEAYEVLNDPEKRSNYDKYGSAEAPRGFGGMNFNMGDFAGGFSNFGDIFGDIFSSFGGGRRTKNSGKRNGDSLQMRVQLTFDEAVKGVEKVFKLKKYELCSHCHGTGAENPTDIKECVKCKGTGHIKEVKNTIFGQMESIANCDVCHGTGKEITNKCHECKGNKYIEKLKSVTVSIPSGVETGDQFTLTGYGEPGINGGIPGDLILVYTVKEHPYFKRNGLDIYIPEFPVSFLDIIKENEIYIPTPYGNEKVQMKRTYQTDKILTLKGKGIKKGTFVGDLKLSLKVIIPDIKEKEIKKMAETLTDFSDKSNIEIVDKINKAK